MNRLALLPALFALCLPALAQQPRPTPAFERALAELQHIHGLWNATTEMLRPDGTVARTVKGTYRFEWVVPGRVLTGRSEVPELQQVSALLFYVNEEKQISEMVSVGADGNLFIMTGAAGSDVRATAAPPRLRFTRFNVTADRFESKMEVSADNGATWQPANHQIFVRAA